MIKWTMTKEGVFSKFGLKLSLKKYPPITNKMSNAHC